MRVFITCVAMAFGLVGAAQAASPAQPQPVRVAYGDLNLSNPAQAATFKARVEAAGWALCRAKLRAGDLSGLTPHACVVNVRREAESQLPPAAYKALVIGLRAQPVELAAK